MAGQKQPDGFLPNVFAGGVAGGVAAVITSPLEVIKTRLQSTTLYGPTKLDGPLKERAAGLRRCGADIIKVEGIRALTKGLSVTLMGVIPTRAVYFSTYYQGKRIFSDNKRSPFQVHLLSSTLTGLVNVTWSNPLFVVRTRQQLKVDSKGHKLMSFGQCARGIYQADGLMGFTRGISASYAGIAETVLALVLYEHFKHKLNNNDYTSTTILSNTSLAAGSAKLIATSFCYPHEVIRTRLRETPGSDRKYKSFVQTMRLTFTEEGVKGLYRGLVPQLIRVVPNHAIMFLTFEYIVRLLNGSSHPP